ncbi:MAG: hypothetical protein ABI947_26180 [Chloroflexota bacterium]
MIIKSQTQRILLIFVVALLPALITLGLVRFYLGASLGDFIPSYQGEMNDSIHNWREIYTFNQVGFKGGYYTVNEIPARVGFTHYYAYGPAYPMFYGLIGRFTGWLPASPPIFNMVLITITLLGMLIWLRFDNRQLAYVALLIVTFWPLLLYIPSNMMESLNHAFAFVLAALFYEAIRHSGQVSIRFVIVGLVAILFAALFRLTWILLALPFLLVTLRNGSRSRLWIAVISAGGLIVTIELLAVLLNAPFPLDNNNPGTIAENFTKVGFRAIGMAADAALPNLFRLFIGTPLEFAERIIVFVLLVYLLGQALRWVTKRTSRAGELSPPETLVHLLNLGTIATLRLRCCSRCCC